MQLIAPFTPITSGSGKIITPSKNRNSQLVLYNGSLNAYQLFFNDGTSDYLPPLWAKSWRKLNPFNVLNYSFVFVLVMNANPNQLLVGTVYEKDEQILDINVPYQSVFNIGGI